MLESLTGQRKEKDLKVAPARLLDNSQPVTWDRSWRSQTRRLSPFGSGKPNAAVLDCSHPQACGWGNACSARDLTGVSAAKGWVTASEGGEIRERLPARNLTA
jgi:hypothetical protein